MNDQHPKLKIGEIVRISKYNHCYKPMFQIGLKKFLCLKKLKCFFRVLRTGHMVLVILIEKKLLKHLQKLIAKIKSTKVLS